LRAVQRRQMGDSRPSHTRSSRLARSIRRFLGKITRVPSGLLSAHFQVMERTSDDMALTRATKEKAILAAIGLLGTVATAWITANQSTKSSAADATTEAIKQAVGPAVREAAKTALSGAIPVGSVVASMLTPDQMAEAFGRTWLPADGRSIGTGSAYARLTGKTHLPDMRGVFPRGLNQFDGAQPARDPNERDPDTRVVASYQADMQNSHSHKIGFGTSDVGAYKDGFVLMVKGGRMPSFLLNDPYTNYSAPSTDPAGGLETRPKIQPSTTMSKSSRWRSPAEAKADCANAKGWGQGPVKNRPALPRVADAMSTA
jgi:hypothetical protein